MIKGFKLFGMWAGFWWYSFLADVSFSIYNNKLRFGRGFDAKFAKESIKYDEKAMGILARIDNLKESLI